MGGNGRGGEAYGVILDKEDDKIFCSGFFLGLVRAIKVVNVDVGCEADCAGESGAVGGLAGCGDALLEGVPYQGLLQENTVGGGKYPRKVLYCRLGFVRHENQPAVLLQKSIQQRGILLQESRVCP